MPPKFDIQQAMSPNFRARLSDVLRDPPSSQFDYYGELLGYLGCKFPVQEGFLTKPQKNFRLLAGTSPGMSNTHSLCSISLN